MYEFPLLKDALSKMKKEGYPMIKQKMPPIGGCPVTDRIRQVTQPRGGYIPPRSLSKVILGDGIEALNPNEVTNAGLVGLSVDYLTRFMLGSPLNKAFEFSLMGARVIHDEAKAQRLLNNVKGLDCSSVINAVKLTGYDVCYRAGPSKYKPVDEIVPDSASVENIITMVKRSLHFFEVYGPIVLDGFSFKGGYTDIVSTGDGDFTTKDTLWDFKVSKLPVKKEYTLQLLMYWRMGLHSIHPEFKEIKYLGIYNPRMNIVYRIAVADISEDVIREVEREIIGYK